MWTTDINGVVERAAALEAGRTDAEIRQAVRCGELVVACRGMYIPRSSLPDEPWRLIQEVYRRRCLTIAARTPGLILSHQSAAAIQRIEMLKPDLTRLHESVESGAHGKRLATRHIHTRTTFAEVTRIDGLLVTDLPTTAVDVAAGTDFAGALAVLDSALRLGVTRDELRDALDSRRRRGSDKVRAALRLADGRSANPGESWGRAQLIEASLPVPDLQVEVRVADRVYYSDYDWDGLVIGEFDGRAKYLANLKPGESIGDAVMREKDRENALRDMGFDVVRWDWVALERHEVAARVRPRLEAARLVPRHF
ncbi:CTP synthase [Gordonia spumicola]|uniref:CTP synthase n=1 Tax=Gordonia spumicola TaxID=589161 RepID=A0A7I9V3G9_9ACTN|nr:hypothetical protein [Gordonia spumicola]GED99756.1 CTP synthase [Gordonia spumicola]